MTISQLLAQARTGLKKKEIPSHFLDSEVLLAYSLDRPKEYLYTYPEEIVTDKKKKKFLKLIKRRSKGEPLAYLLGFKEFYGRNFQVNKRVLIPRPETETLVTEILNLIPDKKVFNIFDIGTGSGCIAVTLAKILEERENFNQVFALDIDKRTLKLAQKNAQKHEIAYKIKFVKSNLLNYFLKPAGKINLINRNHLNIIAANLPYLTKKQFQTSLSISYEPKKALVASQEGLKYYQKLFLQLKKINQSFLVVLEINPEQVVLVKKLISQIDSDVKLEIKKDFSGNDRIVKLFFN